jgi:hypothetical protein
VPPAFELLAASVARVPTSIKTRAPLQHSGNRISPGDLFGDLSGARARPTSSSASVSERVRRALADPQPSLLTDAIRDLGSGAVLVHGVFRRRHQGIPRDVPEELLEEVLEALRAERAPEGLPTVLDGGTEARRGPRDRLELQRSKGLYRGLQTLVPVSGVRLKDVIGRLAELDPSGPVADLRDSALAATRWGVWVAQLARAVREALDRTPGVPDTTDMLPAIPEGVSAAGWSDLFALVSLVSSGAAAQAVEVAAHARGPEIELVRGAIRAAAGDWEGLWRSGHAQLHRRTSLPTVLARLELRSVLAVETVPGISAAELATWLDRTKGDAARSEESLAALVDALDGGNRSAFERVAEALRDLPRLRTRVGLRALEFGVLGRSMATDLLSSLTTSEAEDRTSKIADVLIALVDRPERPLADAAWGVLPGSSTELVAAVADELRRRSDPRSRSLVEAVERRQKRAEVQENQRARLRAAGVQGRLQAFGATLARVLAPSQLSEDELAVLEASTRQALAEAHRDGWLPPILKVLRVQVRRHPDDPARTVWLARGLVIAGQWAEAERAFQAAADAAPGLEARRDRRIEAAHAFFVGGEAERGVRILRDLTIARPDRRVAAAVAAWAAGGDLPKVAVKPVRALLAATRSGIYAGAIRALDQVR